MTQTPTSILAAIPLGYSDGDAYWARDLGLVVTAMRKLGVDARLVALGKRENHDPALPLELGTLDDFRNPEWWRRMNPRAIVLNTWSAPRYDAVRKAALAATPYIMERLDTDGVRSPSSCLRTYTVSTFGHHLDSGSLPRRLLAPFLTLLRVAAVGCFPALLDEKMAHTMSRVPMLAAESPIAVARIQRFMRRFSDRIPEVICAPHPVAEDYMRLDSSISRENRIVSVGRWYTFQKNFPLLLSVLKRFLAIHPHWSADIVGKLPDGWTPEQEFGPDLRDRVRFHGLMEHRRIAGLYSRSKVFFMSSRHESYNISAAEALCCGCSVVGPSDIASVPFFTGALSGTAACRQTGNFFLDALCVEASAWQAGDRDPESISKHWIDTVGATAVARTMLGAFERLFANPPASGLS